MLIEQKINADILKITMLIREDYPELSKYLNEMMITIPDVPSPKMNQKVLQEYYNSLDALLENYIPNHEVYQ